MLESTAGFTAEEIILGQNNTIQQGLLIATRSVTISILNETQPETHNNIFDNSKRRDGLRRLLEHALGSYFGTNDFDHHLTTPRRRLAFYTDEIPVRIFNIFESMFCSGNEVGGACVSVSTEVCVVLTADDVAGVVRLALVQGFRSSIESGAFSDAIPPTSIP